jgi:octaprenyl-diphosphate synthase
MDFQDIYAVVAEEFAAVNRFVADSLDSNVPLVREVGEYIVGGGGKRLRPLMALLSARALGYQGNRHIDVAAVIELLHTATLLHDDVVDESSLRRGHPTVNELWGNASSVLVGDFLISRAFQLAVNIGNMHLLEILSNSTNIISEGEVWQLLNCHDPDITEAHYMRVIHDKTAKMFEASAQTGAALALAENPGDPDLEATLACYGKHMGIAFQLIDDVLDYQGSAAELGKNVGDDLAEGKPTLPLIHALRHTDRASAERIRAAIREGGRDYLQETITLVQSSGGLEYTLDKAREETRKALSMLEKVPASPYRQALSDLAQQAVERHF